MSFDPDSFLIPAIVWEPTSRPRELECKFQQRFIDTLRIAHLELPRTFTRKDVDVIRGMAAAFQSGAMRDSSIPAGTVNTFYVLVNTIMEFGSIKVSVE
jgi:hypothetical protein